jgi:hypothetical protein
LVDGTECSNSRAIVVSLDNTKFGCSSRRLYAAARFRANLARLFSSSDAISTGKFRFERLDLR